MSKLDLHIHSAASDDGEYTPQEIVAMSRAQGMELIAITDHNSVRSVAAAQSEALSACAASGLRVISGVELDCTHKGRNFHLLGYCFDHTRKEFAQIEQDILEQEKMAAREKIRLFQSATGIPVDEDEVLAASSDGVVPGELISSPKKKPRNMKYSAHIFRAEQKATCQMCGFIGISSQKVRPPMYRSTTFPLPTPCL